MSTTNSIDYCMNHPSVNGIIADLKMQVENLHLEFTKVREIIQELARRLDENKICKRETICQTIKEILKEKLAEGKISERYIESCLPIEYKRKYSKKKIIETELCSLSQSASLIHTDEPNNNNSNLENRDIELRPQYNNNIPNTLPKLHDEEFEGCSLCKDVVAENKELKEIVHKNTKFVSAEMLNNGIKISKNQAKDIEDVSKRCKDFIYLLFNMGGNIIRIEADTEIDKDIIQTNTIK